MLFALDRCHRFRAVGDAEAGVEVVQKLLDARNRELDQHPRQNFSRNAAEYSSGFSSTILPSRRMTSTGLRSQASLRSSAFG